MRLSPSGLRYVCVVRGAAPVVTLLDEHGFIKTLGHGQDPRWAGEDEVWWRPQDDGGLWRARAADGWNAKQTAHASGNSLAAAPVSALAVHRTDPVRVIENDQTVHDRLAWPVYSDSGVYLAALAPDQPQDRWQSAVLIGPAGRRTLHQGAVTEGTQGTDFRMAGTTLCFKEADGRVYGIVDVANPAHGPELLARVGEGVSHAVPIYAPNLGLFVLHIRDTGGAQGDICVASWASMLAGTPTGWSLGQSAGSGYDHDARLLTADHARVAWLGPDGQPDEALIDLRAPATRLARSAPPPPTATKPSGPKALGYFYEDGKYGRFDPARNCTVTGAGLWETDANNDGRPELPEDVDMLLDGAIARAKLAFVSAVDVQRPTVRARWAQVLGVFTHEPDSPALARQWVDEARARMRAAGLAPRPVITVLVEEQAANPAYAGVGDALAPEIYLDAPKDGFPPEVSYDAMLRTVRGRIEEVCAALAPSPLYLCVQAFDRIAGGTQWRDRPDLLEAFQQAANEALAREQVRGLWWFAYARPGGVRHYPQLERWHAAQVAATAPPPAIVDPAPKPPTGGPMTPEQVRANCATKWPPDVTLEILRRFNREVVHERDQVGEDNVSGGAAGIYLWPNVAATVYPNLAAQGPPSDPDPAKVFATWMGWFVPGFVNAAKEYWQAQGRPDRLGPQ